MFQTWSYKTSEEQNFLANFWGENDCLLHQYYPRHNLVLNNFFKLPKLPTPFKAAETIANHDYSKTVDDAKEWIDSKKK